MKPAIVKLLPRAMVKGFCGDSPRLKEESAFGSNYVYRRGHEAKAEVKFEFGMNIPAGGLFIEPRFSKKAPRGVLKSKDTLLSGDCRRQFLGDWSGVVGREACSGFVKCVA
jgi:hypothetical protein